MPDLRLVPINNTAVVDLDLLLTPMGELDETAALETAVLVTLCSDALADPSDKLPTPNSSDRRGWWADIDSQSIWSWGNLGSKLWLLTRTNITDPAAREGATISRVQSYILAALQPFIDQKICSTITCTAFQKGNNRIYAKVVVTRGPLTMINLEFQALWTELFPSTLNN